jgi:hypothetical protein
VAALAALTAGCFQPMYAEHTDGTPGLRYFDLFRHEGTHAALYSLASPFGGMDTWFQEGMATTVSQLPMSKASILAAAQASDLLTANGSGNDMGTSYPVYEATIGYLTSSAPGGLGYGLTNIPAFVGAYKARALAACAQPIPNGLIPPAGATYAMPLGDYNVCAPSVPGMIDTRLVAAFDQAFNATFTSNGAPLLLHTAGGPTVSKPRCRNGSRPSCPNLATTFFNGSFGGRYCF